jgi:hypothetical protein
MKTLEGGKYFMTGGFLIIFGSGNHLGSATTTAKQSPNSRLPARHFPLRARFFTLGAASFMLGARNSSLE